MIIAKGLIEKVSIRVLLGILALTVLLNIMFPKKQENFEIDFLNVGQGDSILLRNDNLSVLVDVGRDEMAVKELEKLLPPYKKAIDYIVLTHFDEDHIGGLKFVVDQHKVGKILLENKKDIKFDKVRKLAENNNIEIVQVYAGDKIKHGDFEMYFLSPDYDSDIGIEDRNTRSIVVLASYSKFDTLLTGDLDVKGEERVLKDWVGIESEILKLGHHGSKTSTSKDFLDAVNPQIAIISAGRNNHYGHPSPEVVERLELENIKTLATYDGSISVITDGYKYWIAK